MLGSLATNLVDKTAMNVPDSPTLTLSEQTVSEETGQPSLAPNCLDMLKSSSTNRVGHSNTGMLSNPIHMLDT